MGRIEFLVTVCDLMDLVILIQQARRVNVLYKMCYAALVTCI